jgi:hypothetical protein
MDCAMARIITIFVLNLSGGCIIPKAVSERYAQNRNSAMQMIISGIKFFVYPALVT